MTSNHNTINVEIKKKQENKQNDNTALLTLRSYDILYHTYFLLICKGHVQMTSQHITINVETNKQ